MVSVFHKCIYGVCVIISYLNMCILWVCVYLFCTCLYVLVCVWVRVNLCLLEAQIRLNLLKEKLLNDYEKELKGSGSGTKKAHSKKDSNGSDDWEQLSADSSTKS